jgi:hypothetical protein
MKNFASNCLASHIFLALTAFSIPLLAGAHPTDDTAAKQSLAGPTNPPPAANSTAASPAEVAKSQQPTPAGESGQAANSNKWPDPKLKLRWYDYRKYHSLSNVKALIAQAVHAHWPNDQTRPPLEIWYVATRKPSPFPAKFTYCVSPRVELPGPMPSISPGLPSPPTTWSEQVVIHLLDGGTNLSVFADVSVPLPLEIGASREMATVPPWCEIRSGPPNWVIQTDHGRARVVFLP